MDKKINEILDWHSSATSEAFIETIGKGVKANVYVTDELLQKHRKRAELKLKQLMLDERIDELNGLDYSYEIELRIGKLTDELDEIRNEL
jgi:hypothetical protein